MNLRLKMLLAMAVLFSAMVVVFYVLSSTVILRGFADVEKDSVCQNVDRVIQALDDRLEGLDRSAKDWAWWDETYAFVEGGNKSFIESNVSIDALEALGIDVIAFVRKSGEVTFSTAVDHENRCFTPPPTGFQGLLSKWPPLKELEGRKGILLFPDKALIVASRAILTSQQQGPVRGALIMGVYLDATEVEHLSKVTRSSIRIERMDDPALPPDFLAAKQELAEGESICVRTRGRDSISGYAAINDLNGLPILLLQVDMTRPIMSHARKMLLADFLYMVAAGILFSVIVIILLERMVVARVVKLGAEVSEVGLSGGPMAHVSASGRDELAHLASNINRMLDGLDKSSKDLQHAREELEVRVRERTAQLEEANRELESFSYSVSHDLRAPLRAIDGFSQTVLDECAGKMEADTEANLRWVRAAAQRMSRLIDSLLAMSRLSRREMRREHVDLSQIARSVVQDYQKKVPGREVSIMIQDGVAAEGDPDLLRIVLENLLSNAWKFTSKHEQATIEFGMMGRDGRILYFIRDDGAGFDMQYADKLFGAFQRLHSEQEFEGTGIGLAIVQRIIHRHGGKVWAESEMEKGATFYFTI